MLHFARNHYDVPDYVYPQECFNYAYPHNYYPRIMDDFGNAVALSEYMCHQYSFFNVGELH